MDNTFIKKIWLVTQESNVDGEITFNAAPCISEEIAKKVMEQKKNTILTESNHYKKHNKDDFKIEDDDVHFFIQDLYDDYYEYITIEVKQIQY